MKNAVIIGAGQTGRGFIAPILQDDEYTITFIDKDEELIKSLNQKKKYSIRYFGNTAPTRKIDAFKAFVSTSEEAAEALRNADVICTSVFSSHLAELIPLFREVEKERKTPMQIICCENGVNVKKDLVAAKLNACITEGIIFCTTLRPNKDSLDLLCENIQDLPIDASVEGLTVSVRRMPLERKFADLIQRKIYTYNFMSAIVSYLGWYKGYEIYGKAANDSDIAYVIEKIKPVVSRVIAHVYAISEEEQLAFTQRAIDKFQNEEIIDTIYRNARQAKRKLGANERILSPMRMATQQAEDITWMKLIAVAAMDYAVCEENEELESVYQDLQAFLPEKDILDIRNLLEKFQSKESLSKMIQSL
ncbi:NAD(P)-binding domain-containing protein [Faecalicoccus pleomorphus]|uniref:mannitol dehydrogenase family protein n=1 Tax=Faecalicoccus pleomorphus TaxID=1323 RepID=UPI0019616871|nr:NAD(P)-binding domain-containing protein [Faecalicoccus pleomorphus]MBM6764707.1 NAD(P)-binding domain-containing protein [Faecalicoccus pleomorphus]